MEHLSSIWLHQQEVVLVLYQVPHFILVLVFQMALDYLFLFVVYFVSHSDLPWTLLFKRNQRELLTVYLNVAS